MKNILNKLIVILVVLFLGVFPYDTDDSYGVVMKKYGLDVGQRTLTPSCMTDGIGVHRAPFGIITNHCETQLFILFNIFPFQIKGEKIFDTSSVNSFENKKSVALYEEDGDFLAGDTDPLGRNFANRRTFLKRYDYDDSVLWYIINQGMGELNYVEPENVRGDLAVVFYGKTAQGISKSIFELPSTDADIFLRLYDRSKPNMRTIIALSENGKILDSQTKKNSSIHYEQFTAG